jgi:CheY-like chemotaxis protein
MNPSAHSASPPHNSHSDYNVLIVEDNLINQKMLANLLKRQGYNCVVASNGEEGVKLYQSMHFRIIFMDIEMPVMNGIDATICIRKFEAEMRIPSAFIICLTGIAQDELIADSYAAGVDTYVAKPFDACQITNMLHLIVQSFQKPNQISLK